MMSFPRVDPNPPVVPEWWDKGDDYEDEKIRLIWNLI
jgi:hypothetical protein